MEMVLDTSHRPQRQPITPYTSEQNLAKAIKNNEGLERVRSLVEEGADISCLCDNCWTPLTLAAYLGKADIVEYLLHCVREASNQPKPQYRWRITVDSANDSGHSPLYSAACQGHVEVCHQLLEAGADINIQCQYSKQTPLLGAVESQRREVIKLLLDRGADVQLTDNVGITPLYIAIEGNCCDIVQQLINVGCDVNVGSQDHAPIFLAARKGFLPIVQMLCEAGCYKDIANKYGVTALYEAAFKGHNSIVAYLLESRCDINRCDMYKVSPLQGAVMMGNLEGVRLLVNAGACVKWRNSQGKCAVQIALEMGKDSVLEFFLASGVDVTKRPNLTFIEPGRMSPLRIVFEKSALHPKTILLLLRGCSRLDLRMLSSTGAFGTQPALLDLAFTSGLSHPPGRLLTPPSVETFSTQCLQWLEHHRRVPQSLKSLSRACIRSSLGNTIFHAAPKLPLPGQLVEFLLFSEAVIQPL